MTVIISEKETVEQLKRMVGLKIGVNFRSIRLTFGSKPLLDKSPLGEFLTDQVTLHLSLRLLGGSGDEKVST